MKSKQLIFITFLRRFNLNRISILAYLLICSSVYSQSVQWGKKGGGSGGPPLNSGDPFEEAKGIGTDNNGNVYVAWQGIQGGGATIDGVSVNIPFSTGNLNDDIIISSFSCSGQYRWSKVIGCPNKSDLFKGFGVDSLGNTYLQVASTQLGCFKVDNDTTTPASSLKLWHIIKYDSSGNFKWLLEPASDTANQFINFGLLPYTLHADKNGTLYSTLSIDIIGNTGLKNYSPSFNKGEYLITINNQGQIINHIKFDIRPTTISLVGNLQFHKPKNQNRFYFWGDHNGYIDSIGNIPIVYKDLIACFDMQGNLKWKRELEDSFNVSSSKSWASSGLMTTDLKGDIYFNFRGQILSNDSINLFGYKITNDNIPKEPLFPLYDSYVGFIKLDTNGNFIWGNHDDSYSTNPNLVVCGNRLIESAMYPSYPGLPFTPAAATYKKGNFTLFKSTFPWGFYIAVMDINTGQYLQIDTSISSNTGVGAFEEISYKGVKTIAADNKGQVYIGGKFYTDVKYNSQTITSSGGETDMFIFKWGDTCGAILGLDNSKFKIQDSYNLKIFPNPASKKINISFSKSINNAEIFIYDMMGKIVYTAVCKTNHSIDINTNELLNGIYNIVLKSNGKMIVAKKLMISN